MSRRRGEPAQSHDVLIRLAKSEAVRRGDLDATLREVTEAAAGALDVERVNVWLFDERRTRMRCIEHYERSSGHQPGGLELLSADYPGYFAALAEERAIVAGDARADPRTCEFATGYLDVHGIGALLDAPLRSGGEVVGILCHEHVGPPRAWTEEEQHLAASLADIAALALESAERRTAEDALRASERRTREIVAHALDAIVIADEQGVINDWNPRAEAIFGWTRGEAIGRKLQDTVIPERHREEHERGMRRFLDTGEGRILDRRIEMTARDRYGREFPVELSVSAMRIGERWMFSAFARDISDRVRAEHEVRALNAELEERVRVRTRQLEGAVRDKERVLGELQASSAELLDRLSELEHKSETIRMDLERAQVIQRALLPAQPPALEGVHVDALYRPGMNVGGDLYDVIVLDDRRVALYVADAAGHGVAAAMLSVLFKQRLALRDEAGRPLAPAEVLRRVNARIFHDVLAQGLFLTAAYVLLDTHSGVLHVASAGHPPMLLRRAGGENVLLERSGPALGLVREAEFAERRVEMRPGDRLMVYTDGLLDGLGIAGTRGLLERLVPALSGDSADTPARLRGLFAEVDRLRAAEGDGPGRDDVTLLVLESRAGSSSFDNQPPRAGRPPAPAAEVGPAAQGAALWLAEDDATTCIAVRGVGHWLHAESFRRLARAARDGRRRLSIDLADCAHLDSAFLGTLHEVVTGRPAGEVVVHRPRPGVSALFVELGLERVQAAVSDAPARPSCAPAPVPHELAGGDSRRRLLRAHEILAELGESNRERFAGLVETLRAELGEQAGGAR